MKENQSASVRPIDLPSELVSAIEDLKKVRRMRKNGHYLRAHQLDKKTWSRLDQLVSVAKGAI